MLQENTFQKQIVMTYMRYDDRPKKSVIHLIIGTTDMLGLSNIFQSKVDPLLQTDTKTEFE